MQAILLFVHIVVCLAMIGIVLLQQGKGAEVGAVFGGSSQTLFGSSGATTFLGKLTTVVAVVFMLTSIGLTYMANHAYENSIMENAYDAESSVPPQTSEAQQPVQEKAAAPMGGAVDAPSPEDGGDVQTEAARQAAPEQEAAASQPEAAAPEEGSQPEEE